MHLCDERKIRQLLNVSLKRQFLGTEIFPTATKSSKTLRINKQKCAKYIEPKYIEPISSSEFVQNKTLP